MPATRGLEMRPGQFAEGWDARSASATVRQVSSHGPGGALAGAQRLVGVGGQFGLDADDRRHSVSAC